MSGKVSSKIISDGLVLYLDAANTRSYPGSGVSWKDLSRSVNNGSLVGSPTFNSSNGGTIVFDGINNFVSVPDSNSWDFTNSLTIECWVYVNSYDPGGVMFLHQQNGLNPGGFELWVQGTTNVIRFNKNTTTSIIVSSGVFATGKWNHVVVTIDGTVGIIYLNTVVVGSTSTATLPDNVAGQLRIGSYANTGFYELNGRLSCLRIYKDKALTSSEVIQNYNATKSRFGL